MIIVKLGGSVITDKSEYKKFRRETVARIAKEIAESGKEVIIVHGAGSFGHIEVNKHSLQDGFKDKSQIPAMARVMADTRQLSNMVIEELLSAGLSVVSVPPGSCYVLDDGRIDIKDNEALPNLRKLGIMPVLFGDICPDHTKGFQIVSGDQIMERICERLEPEKVIFVSDVDGLFDTDPKKNPNARRLEVVTKETLAHIDTVCSVDDVTGGIRGKMETMLRMTSENRECLLINGNVPGRVKEALEGKEVICTRAKGGI